MKSLVKKHEAPQFEVVMNKESNKKFFVASTNIDNTSNARGVHVDSWNSAW